LTIAWVPSGDDLDAIVDANDSRRVSQNGLQDLFQVKGGENSSDYQSSLAKIDAGGLRVSLKMRVTTQPLQGLVHDLPVPATAPERLDASLAFAEG
jgi:hypothetical protein